MSQKKKYQLLTILTVLAFLYIGASEIISRTGELFQLYAVLQAKESSMLSPAELAQKKVDLISRKRILTSMITHGSQIYEQSETGVFEYINANAKEAGIRFESIMPVEVQSGDQIKEIGFKVNFTADYHRTGSFINALETGGMLVRMERISAVSRSATSPLLTVNAEGSGYIVSVK